MLYWEQYSHAELLSLHGIEVDGDLHVCFSDLDLDLDATEKDHRHVMSLYDKTMLTNRDFL